MTHPAAPPGITAPALPPVEQQAPPELFTHTMPDGTRYEAGSVQAAMGVCPFLGRLSAEQAGLLLQLSAMGQPHPVPEAAPPPDTPPVRETPPLLPLFSDKPPSDEPSGWRVYRAEVQAQVAEPSRRYYNEAVHHTAATLKASFIAADSPPAIAESPTALAIPVTTSAEPIRKHRPFVPAALPTRQLATEPLVSPSAPAVRASRPRSAVPVSPPPSPAILPSPFPVTAEHASPPTLPPVRPLHISRSTADAVPAKQPSPVLRLHAPPRPGPPVAKIAKQRPSLPLQRQTEVLAQPIRTPRTAEAVAALPVSAPAPPVTTRIEASPPTAESAAPPITATVVERLAVQPPHERPTVQAVLTELAALVQVAQDTTLPEARKLSSVPVEQAAAIADLEAQCAVLFRALAIPCTEADIRQYARYLITADTLPPVLRAALSRVDIERRGTHEIKRRAPRILDSVTAAEDRLAWLIGTLLLRPRPRYSFNNLT